MILRDKFFINGQWVAPASKDSIDVHNAGTGEVMGKVPAGTEKDIDAAVAAARAALDGWSATPVAKRAEFLQEISDGLKARAAELASTIAQEVGMPIKMAGRIQAGLPIANFANYAKIASGHEFEKKIGNSLVVQEPVGVVGAITPWNYPLHQIALKVAPALAAGCTVVLKPSEIAPFNAFILAEVVEASSAARAFRPSEIFCRHSARFAAGVALQPSSAARAAATAASMSFSVPAGTLPMTSPVPALCTSMLSLEAGATHWPLMKNLSRRIMELFLRGRSGPLL